MTSHVATVTNQPFWDALWACARPHKLTLLASSFGAKISFRPNVGVRFWFGLTQGSFIRQFPFYILNVHDAIFWKFIAFISLTIWCGTFVWHPTPLKERWCPHHVLCFLPLCRSIVEVFYGFLGMFHIWFVHPRCLYRMVSFPLD